MWANLGLAWEYHTGDVPPADTNGSLIAFEDQPSLIEGNLVVCTPSRRLIALDPQTGKERWVYDPKAANSRHAKMPRHCQLGRPRRPLTGASCKTRIFVGTTDNRLVAIDATNGKPCDGLRRAGRGDRCPPPSRKFSRANC